MTHRFFSYDLSNFDSLRGQVIGRGKDRIYIKAKVPHDSETCIFGFSYDHANAPIGSRVWVSIIKEFPDVQFRFSVEAIEYGEFLDLIKGLSGKLL